DTHAHGSVGATTFTGNKHRDNICHEHSLSDNTSNSFSANNIKKQASESPHVGASVFPQTSFSSMPSRDMRLTSPSTASDSSPGARWSAPPAADHSGHPPASKKFSSPAAMDQDGPLNLSKPRSQ
ncbi:unnamed protein product, partial [Candidula unifasciata]